MPFFLSSEVLIYVVVIIISGELTVTSLGEQFLFIAVPEKLFFCEYLTSPPVISRGLIYRAKFKLAEILVVFVFIDNLHVTLSP